MTREEKILKLVELSQNDESCISEYVQISNLLRVVDGDLQHLFIPLTEFKSVTIPLWPSVKKLTFKGCANDYAIAKQTKKD